MTQPRDKNGKFMSNKVNRVLPQKDLINYVAFVLDNSGSMAGGKWDKAKEVFNRLSSEMTDRPGQRTIASLLTFNDQTRRLHKNVRVSDLSLNGVYPNGNTALRQAVHDAIMDFEKIIVHPNQDVSYLIITLTDGEENASNWCSNQTLSDKIRSVQSRGNWTLAFQVPPGARYSITQWGVPSENVTEWENSAAGLEKTYGDTVNAYSTFTTARSMGMKSVSNFYQHTTDLSQLNNNDLRQLDNLTNRFKMVTVPGEVDIQKFIETNVGQVYIPGTAFFQLTKPEKIQANKQVLLVEKGKKTIYGGPKARKLVGLQDFKDGKVTPGNHANFDILVQSTSNNRKLVRGTKLAVLK